MNTQIKNGIYYKVTGTINKDTGGTITNPVLKIGLGGIETAQQTGVYHCEYEVFESEQNYLDGFYFQKAWDAEKGERIKNFTAPYDPELSGANAPEKQRGILAAQFGWNIEDVVLVEEVEEEVEEV